MNRNAPFRATMTTRSLINAYLRLRSSIRHHPALRTCRITTRRSGYTLAVIGDPSLHDDEAAGPFRTVASNVGGATARSAIARSMSFRLRVFALNAKS